MLFGVKYMLCMDEVLNFIPVLLPRQEETGCDLELCLKLQCKTFSGHIGNLSIHKNGKEVVSICSFSVDPLKGLSPVGG